MTVNELLNTMTKEFRESLWDIFIDNDEINYEVDASTVKSEVDHWYIEPPYTTGHFFVMKMCIYTKRHMELVKEREKELFEEFDNEI